MHQAATAATVLTVPPALQDRKAHKELLVNLLQDPKVTLAPQDHQAQKVPSAPMDLKAQRAMLAPRVTKGKLGLLVVTEIRNHFPSIPHALPFLVELFFDYFLCYLPTCLAPLIHVVQVFL